MRFAPAMLHTRSTAATLAATAALTAVAAVPACAAVTVDRSQLITDLADRLGQASALTFTAGYEVSGGSTVTVAQAQNPTRLALAYPDGKVMLSSAQITVCVPAAAALAPAAGAMVCTVHPTSAAARSAALRAAATQAGLPALESVADLLGAAAADANVVVDRRDTTLVGRHASCVSVSGLTTAEPFDACVTSDGVLASFAGTMDGKEVRVTLTRYRDAVDADAFDPPAGAVIQLPSAPPTSPSAA